MPKMDTREALLEAEERARENCLGCGMPTDEGWEPYCWACGTYHSDLEAGLLADDWEMW